MSIKLVLLKSGETIISDIKELISEEKVCGYLLNNPHKVQCNKPVLLVEENNSSSHGELQVSLLPWIIITTDTQIPISPDCIVTIVEPINLIKKMYEEKVNGENSQVSFTEE